MRTWGGRKVRDAASRARPREHGWEQVAEGISRPATPDSTMEVSRGEGWAVVLLTLCKQPQSCRLTLLLARLVHPMRDAGQEVGEGDAAIAVPVQLQEALLYQRNDGVGSRGMRAVRHVLQVRLQQGGLELILAHAAGGRQVSSAWV